MDLQQEERVKGNSKTHRRQVSCALLLVLASAWNPAIPARAQQAAGQNQNGGFAESRGVRVQVPPGWSINRNLIAAAGPVALTNFGGVYLRGGILPPGGAEIEVTSIRLPADLQGFVRNELRGTVLDPVRPFSDSGKVGLQAAYTFDLSAGAVEKNVAIYIPRGAVLYKFYLSYWNGDRNEANLINTLGRVVREAQLR
jgi:hypothetical protein